MIYHHQITTTSCAFLKIDYAIYGPQTTQKLVGKTRSIDHIDYEADAVLFFRTNEKARKWPLRFRRFNSTWQAIIFAVESLRPSVFKGCSIEAGKRQIFCKEIFDIY